jgi:hypothetical protein
MTPITVVVDRWEGHAGVSSPTAAERLGCWRGGPRLWVEDPWLDSADGAPRRHDGGGGQETIAGWRAKVLYLYTGL